MVPGSEGAFSYRDAGLRLAFALSRSVFGNWACSAFSSTALLAEREGEVGRSSPESGLASAEAVRDSAAMISPPKRPVRPPATWLSCSQLDWMRHVWEMAGRAETGVGSRTRSLQIAILAAPS